jgi:hypothetical protein
LRICKTRDFLDPAMAEGIFSRALRLTTIAILAGVALFPALSGCFGFYTHSDNDVAVGEDHQVDLPQDQAYVMTQDVLRGQGILFDREPFQTKLTTMWKPADKPEGTMSNLIGNVAQYRYEIEVVPDGSRRSTIVANVRTENIPADEIDNYKASKRLNLFSDFDQLASRLPPPPLTPGSGGVNFAILPGENLAALAKRVTGNPDNWPQIAKDNGLKSVNDTAGLQSVWIANSLLPKAKQAPPHAAGGT